MTAATSELKLQCEFTIKELFTLALAKHIERHGYYAIDFESDGTFAQIIDKDVFEACGLSIAHIQHTTNNSLTLTFAMSAELFNCFNCNNVSITCDIHSWITSGRQAYKDIGYVEEAHIDGLSDNVNECIEILQRLSGFHTLAALRI